MKLELSEEEVNYLKIVFLNNEFEIKNDMIHCELGSNELVESLVEAGILDNSFLDIFS